MKAKYTVINDDDIVKTITGVFKDKGAPLSEDYILNRISNPVIEALREAQAEISFRAGIKAMVDDIESNFMIKDSPNPDFLRNGIIIASPEQWQAKLKEWGIDKEV